MSRNPLIRLPPNITMQDVRAVVPDVPTIATAHRHNLLERDAVIFVGATQSGKSTLLRELGIAQNEPLRPKASQAPGIYYGVLDDSGQHTDEFIMKSINEMLRVYRAEPPGFKTYKPIVMLRNATWHRIRKYYHWLDQSTYVSTYAFPGDLFVDKLRELSPAWFVNHYLGARWVAACRDARDHFLPKYATDALGEIHNISNNVLTSKARALIAASAGIAQSPTFLKFVSHLAIVVPDDQKVLRRWRPLVLRLGRLEQRLRGAARFRRYPDYMTRAEFIDAVTAEGAGKNLRAAFYTFASPFARALIETKQKLLTFSDFHAILES